METTSEGLGWSSLHDLALIYLALMHGADASIDPAETSLMSKKLRAWAPKPAADSVGSIIRQVMLVYVGESGRQMLDASVASLRETLPKGQRVAVLNDLADIATADGMLATGEVNFIQQLAHIWEVESDDAS